MCDFDPDLIAMFEATRTLAHEILKDHLQMKKKYQALSKLMGEEVSTQEESSSLREWRIEVSDLFSEMENTMDSLLEMCQAQNEAVEKFLPKHMHSLYKINLTQLTIEMSEQLR